MQHGEYLAVLAAGWTALVWVDRRFGTRVLGDWRLVVVVAVNLVLFLGWDSLGVHRGYWRSDPRRVLGLWPLPGVPVEELVLLAMISYAAIVLWQLACVLRPRISDPVGPVKR